MTRYFVNFILLICLSGAGCALTGCAGREQRQQNTYLIKVGDKIMTVGDFNKAFEIAKAAYTYEELQQPEVIREAMLRLVKQMTEEMVLLERAKELGITVTQPELEKAVADIKGEYPGSEFQDSLIENAVPYLSWKEALKRRLIMEKVIAKDLGDHIQVTPDEISSYEKANSDDFPAASDSKAMESKTPDAKISVKDRHDAVAKLLRREKLEKAYPSWLEALNKKYIVQINQERLKKMTDLKQIRKRMAH